MATEELSLSSRHAFSSLSPFVVVLVVDGTKAGATSTIAAGADEPFASAAAMAAALSPVSAH
eukprot:1194660-Prorocentrum_minimum.AAC.1